MDGIKRWLRVGVVLAGGAAVAVSGAAARGDNPEPLMPRDEALRPPRPDDPVAVEALRKAGVNLGMKDGNVHFINSCDGADFEWMRHLKGLHSLKWMIWPSGATDEHLIYLKDVPSLRELHFDGTSMISITEAGLVHLEGLANLRSVTLHRKFGDEALKHLGKMQCLERINMTRGQVTDSGLRHLVNLKRLKAISLSECKGITNDGLRSLAGLHRLESLHLSATYIDDAGLLHLAGLSELRTLGLGQTAVTDAGLVHLRRLTKLEILRIYDTNVSIEAVKKILPNVTRPQ